MDTQLLTNRYEVVRSIGTGAITAVLEARDRPTGARVAIKVPIGRFKNDKTLLVRLEREVSATAGFHHPNVAAVHAVERNGSQGFVVTELVDAPSLREVLAVRGRLSPARAARAAAGVCSALASAHARGIVHGHLTPDNIMMTGDGWVKVTDFRLAEAARPFPRAPDPAIDLRALGRCLATMLTGQEPAGRGPVLLGPEVSPELAAIARKATANPPDSYSSAADLGLDLDRFLATVRPAVPPVDGARPARAGGTPAAAPQASPAAMPQASPAAMPQASPAAMPQAPPAATPQAPPAAARQAPPAATGRFEPAAGTVWDATAAGPGMAWEPTAAGTGRAGDPTADRAWDATGPLDPIPARTTELVPISVGSSGPRATRGTATTSRQQRRRLVVAACLVAAVLVVGGSVAAMLRIGGGDRTGTTESDLAAPPAPAAGPAATTGRAPTTTELAATTTQGTAPVTTAPSSSPATSPPAATATTRPAPRAVPNVVGLRRQQASNELTQAGLKARFSFSPVDSASQVQRVISQQPAAGTVVPSGSAVTVVIGTKKPSGG
jgi:eukaryotic-like serine/threonine-protein kinase